MPRNRIIVALLNIEIESLCLILVISRKIRIKNMEKLNPENFVFNSFQYLMENALSRFQSNPIYRWINKHLKIWISFEILFSYSLNLNLNFCICYSVTFKTHKLPFMFQFLNVILNFFKQNLNDLSHYQLMSTSYSATIPFFSLTTFLSLNVTFACLFITILHSD